MSNYLKDRRKELGLTQKEVAEYVEVSESAVSKWEKGDIENMKRDKIKKYSEILRCSTNFIMNGEDEPDDDGLEQYLYELKNRSEMRMLFDVSKNATKEQIEAIVKFIEGLQKN